MPLTLPSAPSLSECAVTNVASMSITTASTVLPAAREPGSSTPVSYGLPRITLHGLRHTWATLALEQGIHPRVVQERLGHSTIAITLGIYSHVSPTLHDEAAQAVADMMLPPTL